MLLNIKDLVVGFHTYRGRITAVRGVSYDVAEGEMVGIVGESGCGKSVTAHAVMGLLPKENAFIERGSITFAGQELVGLKAEGWKKLRQNGVAMIFQDPMTSLNPVLTIGAQLEESIRCQGDYQAAAVRTRALELLEQVGITQPEERLWAYPHEFSGGMRQRVIIAMALASKPRLLLADEPTTALDVTIQAQIMELLKKLQKELNMAIVLISHNLALVARYCDRINVMYAGKIVEQGSVEQVFYHPTHPYAQGLLRALPSLTQKRSERLAVIAGQPPDLLYPTQGCAFAPRCQQAMRVCLEQEPLMQPVAAEPLSKTNNSGCQSLAADGQHTVCCWLEVAKGRGQGK